MRFYRKHYGMAVREEACRFRREYEAPAKLRVGNPTHIRVAPLPTLRLAGAPELRTAQRESQLLPTQKRGTPDKDRASHLNTFYRWDLFKRFFSLIKMFIGNRKGFFPTAFFTINYYTSDHHACHKGV